MIKIRLLVQVNNPVKMIVLIIYSVPDAVFYSVNNIRSSPNSLKKKLKKGVWTYFVKFDFVDNQFKVTVLYRKVTLGKKVTAILISSWAYFFYEYSAENNRWELKKTEYGGV